MSLFVNQICVRSDDTRTVVEQVQGDLIGMGYQVSEVVTSADEAVTIFPSQDGWVVFFLPPEFEKGEALARRLSTDLETDTFYFHIHAGELWMYVLYMTGVERDRFTSMPEYWEDLEEDEFIEWQGAPRLLASHFGAPLEKVARYLVFLTPEGELRPTDLDVEPGRPPNPGDSFVLENPWVMTDFQERLGIRYPDIENADEGFQLSLELGLTGEVEEEEEDEELAET